tara:strand:+ start:150 stop:443 length:294 start_codon:yes stop_codon:yes gene_type:complete
LIKDIHPLGVPLVSRVKDEAVRIDYSGWSNVPSVGPEDGAAGCTTCTQDAFGAGVENLSLFDALRPLVRWWRIFIDKIGQDFSIRVKKRFHVNNEIF